MNFAMKHLTDIVAIVLVLVGISMVVSLNQYWLLTSVVIGYALSFIPVALNKRRP